MNKCEPSLLKQKHHKCYLLVRTKICSGVPGESLFLVLGFGSNQDLLRSPGGILVLVSWFWFEPRFAQESWGNLGSWFLVLAENAF